MISIMFSRFRLRQIPPAQRLPTSLIRLFNTPSQCHARPILHISRMIHARKTGIIDGAAATQIVHISRMIHARKMRSVCCVTKRVWQTVSPEQHRGAIALVWGRFCPRKPLAKGCGLPAPKQPRQQEAGRPGCGLQLCRSSS